MRIADFLRGNRTYTLMLLFILLVNLFFVPAETETPESSMTLSVSALAIVGLAGFIILLLGVPLFLYFVILTLAKKEPFPKLNRHILPRWGVLDVIKAAVVTVFFAYLVSMIGQLCIPAGVFPVNKSMRLIFNVTLVDLIGISACLYFVRKKYKHGFSSLGMVKKGLLKSIGYGVLGYLAFFPVLVGSALVIFYVFRAVEYAPSPQPAFEFLLTLPFDGYLVYLFLFVGIFGPIAEEILFRGFFYSAIRKRFGVLSGLVLSALVFAALHMNVGAFFPILLLGLFLGYIYEKTGSLASSITVHIAHNSLILGMVGAARYIA